MSQGKGGGAKGEVRTEELGVEGKDTTKCNRLRVGASVATKCVMLA